MSKYIGKNF